MPPADGQNKTTSFIHFIEHLTCIGKIRGFQPTSRPRSTLVVTTRLRQRVWTEIRDGMGRDSREMAGTSPSQTVHKNRRKQSTSETERTNQSAWRIAVGSNLMGKAPVASSFYLQIKFPNFLTQSLYFSLFFLSVLFLCFSLWPLTSRSTLIL